MFQFPVVNFVFQTKGFVKILNTSEFLICWVINAVARKVTVKNRKWNTSKG